MARVFISFDYDYDSDLKTLLVGQAKNPDSPFVISDWSIKVASPTWRDEARKRIRASDTVAVICGLNTDKAAGVATELQIAKEEGISYFLLWGRVNGTCKKPTTANDADLIYQWTWDNLKKLVQGVR
ncbi:TIR domain-containing protein [Promicromonospora sukumoe]